MNISRRAWGALRPPTVVTAPAGYQGPVDIVPGALGFWGLRAASNAAAGVEPAVRLIRSGGSGGSGADEQDIGTDPDTGQLDAASTFFSGTGYTYKVVTLYNQMGGSLGDMVPTSSPSGRPDFFLTGEGGKPCIRFSTTTDLVQPSGAATTWNQPVLMTLVAMRPSKTGSAVITRVAHDWNNVGIVFGGQHNAVSAGGAAGSHTIPDNVLHTMAAMLNGTGSTFRVNDQDDTSGDAGSTTPYFYYGVNLNWSVLGSQNCTATETGFWQGTDHTALLSALGDNMTAFWITGTRAQWDTIKQSGAPAANNLFVSNDGRTVLQASGGGGLTAYHLLSTGATTASQKVYIEHAITVETGVGCRFGFSTASATFINNFGTNTPSISALIRENGTFNCADSPNASATCIPSYTVGDRVGIAFDTQLGKMWFRKNGGAWNVSLGGTQNPVTGDGGVSVPFAGPYYAFFGAHEPELGDTIVTNFATGTWVDAAPTDYTQLSRTV